MPNARFGVATIDKTIGVYLNADNLFNQGARRCWQLRRVR